MHTFYIKNQLIEAHTDLANWKLRWVNGNNLINELYVTNFPTTDLDWQYIIVPYQYRAVDVNGIDILGGSGKKYTYQSWPGELEFFYTYPLPSGISGFAPRILNGILEKYVPFGGRANGDGYHCFNAMTGEPQQPVVYEWGQSDSTYAVSGSGAIHTDLSTGTISIAEPTNGTAPFEYSCTLLGEPEAYGSQQYYDSLPAQVHEVSVRDALGVVQKRYITIGKGVEG